VSTIDGIIRPHPMSMVSVCLSFVRAWLPIKPIMIETRPSVMRSSIEKNVSRPSVAKCHKNETLATCRERIVKAEVHRLAVVDQDDHVIGILSLSDLLRYIIIRATLIEDRLLD
jgi:CBS domain-containing protein